MVTKLTLICGHIIYVSRPYGHQTYINLERRIFFVHIETRFKKYSHVKYRLKFASYLIFYVRFMYVFYVCILCQVVNFTTARNDTEYLSFLFDN